MLCNTLIVYKAVVLVRTCFKYIPIVYLVLLGFITSYLYEFTFFFVNSLIIIAEVDTTRVTTSVHGILGFIPIPFVGIPKDACANNNVDHCPIVNGETIVYSNQIYVNPVYPLVCIFRFECVVF